MKRRTAPSTENRQPTKEQVLQGLQNKDISSLKKTDGGRSAFLVTFEDGSRAIFKPDEFMGVVLNTSKYEVAAFKLSDFLNLNLVPATSSRHTKMGYGSIQDFVVGRSAINEYYTPRDFWPKELTPKDLDMMKMYIFDFLIFNLDRDEFNVIITPNRSLFLIDHTYAFHTGVNVNPYRRRVEPIYLPSLQYFFSEPGKVLLGKLKNLSVSSLRKTLPELSIEEIESLILRRDYLLDKFKETVQEDVADIPFKTIPLDSGRIEDFL